MARHAHDPRHLPMCIERRRPAPAARPWRHLALVLVVLVATAFALRTASTSPAEPSAPVTRELEVAVHAMTQALESLPRSALVESGAEVETLARTIEATLLGIGGLPAPPVDPALTHEIAFLQDLVQAMTAELGAAPRDGEERAQQIARIDRLAALAGARLTELDAMVEAWAEQGRRAIVTVEERPDALLVRSVDRLVHDGARAGGLMLFLIGLLLIGMRLLTVGEGAFGLAQAFETPRSSAGAAALALFMATSLVLGTRPEILLGLSAHTRVQPRPDACRSLVAQRGQLQAAQALSSARLVEAIERRMEGAAATCLALEAEVAAEALEHFVDASATGDGPAGRLNSLVPAARAHAAERQDAAVPARALEEAGRSPAGATVEASGRGAAGARTAFETPALPEPAPLMLLPPDPAPRALVTTTVVNYRAGPSRGADRLGTLPPETVVRPVSQVDAWSVVRLDDGRAVYIASEFLRHAE